MSKYSMEHVLTCTDALLVEGVVHNRCTSRGHPMRMGDGAAVEGRAVPKRQRPGNDGPLWMSYGLHSWLRSSAWQAPCWGLLLLHERRKSEPTRMLRPFVSR